MGQIATVPMASDTTMMEMTTLVMMTTITTVTSTSPRLNCSLQQALTFLRERAQASQVPQDSCTSRYHVHLHWFHWYGQPQRDGWDCHEQLPEAKWMDGEQYVHGTIFKATHLRYITPNLWVLQAYQLYVYWPCGTWCRTQVWGHGTLEANA
jgi:hypothetical protein